MGGQAEQVGRAVAEGRAELAETMGTLARKADLSGRLHDVAEKAGDLQDKATDVVARVGEKAPDAIRSVSPKAKGFLGRYGLAVLGAVGALIAVVAWRRG